MTSAPPHDMQPDTLGRCVSGTRGTPVPASLSPSYRGVGRVQATCSRRDKSRSWSTIFVSTTVVCSSEKKRKEKKKWGKRKTRQRKRKRERRKRKKEEKEEEKRKTKKKKKRKRRKKAGVSDFSVSDFRKHKSVPIGQEISIVCQGENQKKHGQVPKRNMLSPLLDTSCRRTERVSGSKRTRTAKTLEIKRVPRVVFLPRGDKERAAQVCWRRVDL